MEGGERAAGGHWIQDEVSGHWWRFGSCLEVVTTDHADEVRPLLENLEARVERDGLWAAGYIAYEAAPAFDAAMRVRSGIGPPLVWFGLFAPPQLMELPAHFPSPEPPWRWRSSIGRADYDAAIDQIRQHIAAGDTYQVNYTFRLDAPFNADSWVLFRRMIATSRPRCGAYLDCGRFVICSASPELFLRLDGRVLESRPMKGTAGRGLWPAQDAAFATTFRASEKIRAENVMIVDMVRNDIGAVAAPGSVQVPKLFALEDYPGVRQMTSTVRAETDASIVDILGALFAPASVTGAPKIRTMQLIAELETTARGVYTGCIGWLAPGRRAQFNVAIRTAVVDRKLERIEYGVGGGIVWDSTSTAEFEECLLKARTVTAAAEEYALLETLLWEPGTGFFLLDAHLRRLMDSATLLGFDVSEAGIRRHLAEFASRDFTEPQRVRLLVGRDGTSTCEAETLKTEPGAVALKLAVTPVDASDPFLYNKTTCRDAYERARSECPGCDDVLLWNTRGELTETTIANFVAELDGTRVTPPVRSGLLPGVFRGYLLEKGEIVEAPITVTDLRRATRLWTINSVRRWRIARLSE